MPTGIEAFDRLLGGGLPRQQSIVVTGAPGSGKTILTSQIAFSRAAAGEHVVLATVTSESHDKLVHDLRSLSFFDQEHIGDNVFFLNAYPWVKKGPKETREILQSTVRERGASLHPHDVDRIFDRFHRVKHGSRGHGLGLYIAAALARLHGGAIRVESKVGTGSTFTLSLPRAGDLLRSGPTSPEHLQ